MRPVVRFLDDPLIERILDEARAVLRDIGLEVHNPGVVALLVEHGACVDRASGRVHLNDELVTQAVATAPRGFQLYDVFGQLTHELTGHNVYFTPGSAAINILDYDTHAARRPTTGDYIRYVQLVSQLDHLAAQSTAMIPADVPANISDSFRLFLSLLYCRKPVVTGAFTIDAFQVMKEMQVAVRGSVAELRAKPLTIFSCCPTAPLKWSDVTSQNVVDCARHGIPVEFISMPLAGFVAPVTLVGALIQHTAETLSGLVIAQLTNPGTPVLYGGSPAVFDMRYETTPMGAVETMMIDCAYNEIGKHLGLPTQAYIALSDGKQFDAQDGLETSMGATLAALSGINSVSGPGMLDFESCLSLEKLVLDNEICGMARRLVAGVEPKDDFPAGPRFQELLASGHLLISKHTRRYLQEEHYRPGPVIDRANRARWLEEGGQSLGARAHREVERLVAAYRPPDLSEDLTRELTNLMTQEARRHGLERLPI